MYAIHYTRCLAYTPLFSPHNNPGKQYSYLVLQMKKLKLKSETERLLAWALNMASYLHRLCLPFHFGSWHKGGRRDELISCFTWVSCPYSPHTSHSHPSSHTCTKARPAAVSPGLDMASSSWQASDGGAQWASWSLVVLGYHCMDIPTSQQMGQGLRAPVVNQGVLFSF